MNFLIWYAIGVLTLLVTFFVQGCVDAPKGKRISRATSEMYDIFVKRADKLSTVLLGIVALLGPLLPVIFAYFIARNWYDSLAINDDGTKDFPWDYD